MISKGPRVIGHPGLDWPNGPSSGEDAEPGLQKAGEALQGLRGSAGFPACGLGRLSSRPAVIHRTGMSGEPADRNVCVTSRCGIRAWWLITLLAAFASHHVAAAVVKASKGELTLPTYPWAAVKHPYFRGTDKVNIYPY